MYSSATSTWPELLVSGAMLTLVQLLAALPWIVAIDSEGIRAAIKKPMTYLALAGVLIVGSGFFAWFMSYKGDPTVLEFWGRVYGAVLQLQLAVDVPVLLIGLVLKIWPRGGTVALAAFRESYRQPMFWLLFAATVFLLFASMVIPYFTFGDDFKMMKQLGLDMVMLCTVLFCILAASMSVHEEIEGRTAVTLMSKPVTRRQFLLGKFFGILMAGLLMTLLLGVALNVVLAIKPYFDRLDDALDPLVAHMEYVIGPAVQSLGVGPEAKAFFLGAGKWFGSVAANTLCIALGFGQVMVLLAIAASLATRLPMVINLVVCLVIFFLGHLSDPLVEVTEKLRQAGGGIASNLANFLAQLIDKIVPSLSFFSNAPVVIRETMLDPGRFALYVGSVLGYAAMYTAIALLIGLILFDDRDLA
jgi:hypothetical protein